MEYSHVNDFKSLPVEQYSQPLAGTEVSKQSSAVKGQGHCYTQVFDHSLDSIKLHKYTPVDSSNLGLNTRKIQHPYSSPTTLKTSLAVVKYSSPEQQMQNTSKQNQSLAVKYVNVEGGKLPIKYANVEEGKLPVKYANVDNGKLHVKYANVDNGNLPVKYANVDDGNLPVKYANVENGKIVDSHQVSNSSQEQVNTPRLKESNIPTSLFVGKIKDNEVFKAGEHKVVRLLGSGEYKDTFETQMTKVKYGVEITKSRAISLQKSHSDSQFSASDIQAEKEIHAFLKKQDPARLRNVGAGHNVKVLTSDGEQNSIMTKLGNRGTVDNFCRSLNESPESWKTKLKVVRDMAYGVGQLHQFGVIHRDIKADNFVVNQNGKLMTTQIIDMGKCRFESESRPTSLFTLTTPPEIKNQTASSSKMSDIYQLGIAMWQVFCNIPTEELDVAMSGSIFTSKSNFEANCKNASEWTGMKELSENKPELANFIMRMLSENPDARPTVKEVCNFCNDLIL